MRNKTLIATILLLIATAAPQARAQQTTGTVTAKILNVRSAPSLESGAILATLSQGDTVSILRENKEWAKVQTDSGTVGWVAAVYIDTGSSGRDPEQLLTTAEAVFDTSYKIERTTTAGSVEEYKVYIPSRVMEALDLAEKAIHNPALSSMDRALLLRGKCKTVVGWYSLQFKPDYFKTHAADYAFNEVGSNYIYNGADFKSLISKYPKSGLADDAAFELANLPQPGECEGDAECRFERALVPFEKFFSKYPGSDLVPRAIELVNSQAFDAWLDPDKPAAPIKNCCDGFDKKAMLKLVDRYLAAVQPVKTADKAAALHAIADAYAALGRKDSAIPLYNKIISGFPKYENIAHVKESLESVKKLK